MDYLSFNHTLDMGFPPKDFPVEIKALWWERKNYWEKAHEMIKSSTGKDSAWVHAYLHRKEGNLKNASYWYDQAGKPVSELELNDEFKEILLVLLEKYQ